MANHQQIPFWEFIKNFDPNAGGREGGRAGVDHAADAAPPAAGFNPFPSHGAEGQGSTQPPHPFAAGFPFSGQGGDAGQQHPFANGFPFVSPAFWAQGKGPWEGKGPWGAKGPWEGKDPWGGKGRHGRHGRHRHDNEHTPDASRSPSPSGEHTDREAGEEHTEKGKRRHDHGHEGSRGFGHDGEHGGWGGRGGRDGHGHRGFGRGGRGGWGGFGGWGEGFGGRGCRRPGPGHRGPGAPVNFDMGALFESLCQHPLAQAFRTYAEAQRSGETLVPEDADENTFIPPIDVFSTEKSFVLHVALPGAKKEDVGVNWDAEKSLLNLAGVVYRQGDEEFLLSLTKSERKVGVFERTVKLPPTGEEKVEVDGDGITAKLEDGVLVVTVPKVEKDDFVEVKKIDII